MSKDTSSKDICWECFPKPTLDQIESAKKKIAVCLNCRICKKSTRESAFSSARQTLTFIRSLVAPETLEALMVTKYFLQKDVDDMRLLAKYDDETVMALLEELGMADLDILVTLDAEEKYLRNEMTSFRDV